MNVPTVLVRLLFPPCSSCSLMPSSMKYGDDILKCSACPKSWMGLCRNCLDYQCRQCHLCKPAELLCFECDGLPFPTEETFVDIILTEGKFLKSLWCNNEYCVNRHDFTPRQVCITECPEMINSSCCKCGHYECDGCRGSSCADEGFFIVTCSGCKNVVCSNCDPSITDLCDYCSKSFCDDCGRIFRCFREGCYEFACEECAEKNDFK